MSRRILLHTLLASALAASAIAPARAHQPPARNMETLAHLNQYPVPADGIRWPYSSCWVYVHQDGREYALLGVSSGTAIYNITDPESPYRVGFIDGPPSIWREMKSYRSWVYVVTEGTGTGRGVQIVRMTDPEQPVLVNTYVGSFIRSHTVSVDTSRALLICNGTWNGTGSQTGVRVLSLANPEAPAEIGWWPGTVVPFGDSLYVHDTQIDGTRWWFSSIGAGLLRLVDASDPAHPTLLQDFGYPLARTHSSWISADGRYVYACNEDNGLPITVIDVQNPASMQVVGEVTSNPAAIMHNPRVLGSELWVSAYTEGVRVFDLADPTRPAMAAWADTYEGPSGGYNGVWEVCPYLPSGTVVVSDMNTGLFLFRPRREHGVIWVHARETVGDANVPEAHVELASEELHSNTDALGIATLAPLPGADSVVVSRFGFVTARVPFSIATGGRDTVEVALTRLPSRDVTVRVKNIVTGAPIDGAHVEFVGTPLHGHTEAAGEVAWTGAPVQRYDVEVTAPGFAPQEFSWWPSAQPLEVPLTPVLLWDALETAPTGWTVGAAGDNATSGLWTRVEPLGTGPRAGGIPQARPRMRPGLPPRPGETPLHEDHELPQQGNAAPYADNTPGAGTFCFVTGQGTDSTLWDQADVDSGRTTLTSPWMPMVGLSRPMLSLWRWFHSYDASDTEQPDPADHLVIALTKDGTNWVVVDSIVGSANAWTESRFDVRALLGAGGLVRLRVVATDGGLPSTVEAAVDDVAIYEGDAPPLDVPTSRPGLRLEPARPNPARGEVTFSLSVPQATTARFEVLDVAGRIVHAQTQSIAAGVTTLAWSGRDAHGGHVSPGVYLARVRVDGQDLLRRFALVR